jgi:hypothetical protein
MGNQLGLGANKTRSALLLRLNLLRDVIFVEQNRFLVDLWDVCYSPHAMAFG